jgi:hypothetical protein
MGPIYLSKIDISDGFYRIWVRAADVAKLGVLFPSRPCEEPFVGFLLALTMGWKEAPEIFTAVTEKVADLTNHQIHIGYPQLTHILDVTSERAALELQLVPTLPPPPALISKPAPLALVAKAAPFALVAKATQLPSRAPPYSQTASPPKQTPLPSPTW